MSDIRNGSSLPVDPADLPYVFADAFNERNLELLQHLFEPEALHVVRPGEISAGAKRRAVLPTVVRDRVPITVKLRQVYVVGDTALLINDYVHDGTGPDGAHVHVEGTATDVARRDADGHWRYLISNPSGTA
ncbi:YybH family protein [Streptomyces sp. NRRL B-1347]|uniref:YybH family protein n=1 Tax=Streptomyces sp. NRRL B-1347 TaxID=1476877 RepID=UPI0004C662CE|nr:nuclear transport factor 2 family protein [Streptomyces sp. NRRL B-1347]